MKKYKKTTAFRLEPKELDWLENQCKNKKLSPSTVLRKYGGKTKLTATLQERLAASNLYQADIETFTDILLDWLEDHKLLDTCKNAEKTALINKLIEECQT